MSSSSTRLPTPEGSGPVFEAPHVPEGFIDTSGLTRGELLHRGLAASLALGAAGVLADGALGATQAPKARHLSDGLAIQPFRIKVPRRQLADLRRRIAETRWPSGSSSTTGRKGCNWRRPRRSPASGRGSMTGARARRD